MTKWTLSILLVLSAGLALPSAMAEGESREIRHERLNQALHRLSPMSLPQGSWAAYSLCMMERLSEMQEQQEVSLQMLITYIKTFDDYGSDFPGDLAYRMDQDVVTPCIQYNPIIAIDQHMHASH